MNRFEIYMNYLSAISKASSLEGTAKRLRAVSDKTLAGKLCSDIPSVWTGNAANAFVAKGKQLKTEILKEASSLEETARVIRSIAKRTYDTEMRALELAEMRAYS